MLAAFRIINHGTGGEGQHKTNARQGDKIFISEGIAQQVKTRGKIRSKNSGSVRGRLATIIGGWLCYLVRYDDGEREAVWYSDIMLIERGK